MSNARAKDTMKSLLRDALSSSPGRAFLERLRGIVTPNDSWRRRLQFTGPFELRGPFEKPVWIYNSGFFLESEFFWLGYERLQWESVTRSLWLHACETSETILDIGANSGLFSIFAKARNPSAVVYAFEPQPNVFDALRRNVEVNDFDIHCMEIALSNDDSEVAFYNYGRAAFTGNTTAGSLNQSWRPDNQHHIRIQARRLDSFILDHGISKVDLMKIDVETHEAEVIEGYGRLLDQHRPIIFSEIQSLEIGQKIQSLLPTNGYSFYGIDEASGPILRDKLGESSELNYCLCPVDSKMQGILRNSSES